MAPARLHHRHHRRRPAWPDDGHGRGPARLPLPHLRSRTKRPARPRSPAQFTRAAFDDVEALRRFGEQCDVVTYEFENLPVEPLAVLGDKLLPGTRSLAVAQDRADEKRFIESTGARVAPWRDGRQPRRRSTRRSPSSALPSCSRPAASAMTARARPGSARRTRPKPRGKRSAASPPSPKPAMSFDAEFSVILARSADGERQRLPAHPQRA